MKINGIDIKKYDAKQLTADVQPPSFSNSYEWLTSAALPTEFETEVQMGHLKLSIYFKGKDRNNIIRAASEFMSNFTKACKMELDGYKGTYIGFITTNDYEKKNVKQRYIVNLEFDGFFVDDDLSITFDGKTSASFYKVGTRDGIGDTVTLVSKKTRTREKQRIVKITEYPESPEKNTVEISNARKTFAEIQKEETSAATEEAVSISNRATKKVLENYSTTEEIETKITASKKAVEAGVAYTLKNYYTSVQMDSLIKATKEEISQEVKHVEENSMHNYVVNGDFSNGLDDNWYNSNETNNSVMDVSGLGTVAKILKTSSSSSYIRQNLGKIPAGTYRVRYKAATAAGYESTARVQVGALGSYSTTSSGMLKSKEFTTIEREITVSEGTKYIYIYAYTQNAPVYITDA